jgi:hypothetical protein
MPHWVVRWARALSEARSPALAALLAVSLLAAARPGPDFERYLDWSEAAQQGDIFKLDSPILSPLNVPLSLWSPGTGLLLALGRIASGNVLDVHRGAVIAGWLAGLAFWAILFALLQRAAEGDRTLALLGLGALFTGTHAGYYSHAFGSESFGGLLVALLALMIAARRQLGLRDALIAGSAAGLLITIRVQLALYALPALVVLGLRAVPALRGSDRRSAALWLGLLLAPALLGVAPVALVNRWMTGNPLHSPYSFPIGAFSSIDPRRPELLAVLFHPWHGLLIYHPLYLVGLAAAGSLAARATTPRIRLAWLAVMGLTGLQLLVQASWFFWWLGTETFGMRGMAITAVPLVFALVQVISADRTGHPRRWRAWILLTAGACLWSFLLLLQGPTNFHSYPELLAAQVREMGVLLQPRSLVLFAAAALATLAVLPRSGVGDRPAPALGRWATGLTLMPGIWYLLGILAARPVGQLAVFLLAGTVLTLAWLGGSAAAARLRARRPTGGEGVGSLVGSGVLVSFVAALILFGRLAIKTEQRIAAGSPPPRAFACSSSIQWDEVQASYFEYQTISGFGEKQAALRTLLVQLAGTECASFTVGLAPTPVGRAQACTQPRLECRMTRRGEGSS